MAVLTSNLAVQVRDQAEAARRREKRTAALYALSRQLASAAGIDEVSTAIVEQVAGVLGSPVILLLPETDQLRLCASNPSGMVINENELAAATWSWRHNQPAGHGSETLPGAEWFYQPLATAHGTVGVIGLHFEGQETGLAPDQRRLLEALAGQAAVAIERTNLAQDMAQARLLAETERLRSALLSSLSHDLRTPLAAIIGAASSLLSYGQDYDENARRDLLQTIQEEAERLNRFVANLLDMTRLESGVLQLNRQWIEIADVIGSTLARMENRLREHRLDVHVEPALPLLSLDFVLIEQVLINLLDNAIKYAPPGTLIAVRAYRMGDIVCVDVSDEGPGVPPEDLERIFDKFYRVKQGDKYGAGTGLGLSICRGIVDAHGGHISAHLTPGRPGTIFTMSFPIQPAPDVEAEGELQHA